MINPQDYKDKNLGFDRTQLFKEFEGPMIRRAAAMNMAQKFFETNQIAHTGKELQALYTGVLSLLETGDTSIFTKIDKYLNSKE